MSSSSGFLESLFDFSFDSFITTKLIKVLYGLWIAAAAIYALIMIVIGFKIGSGVGVVMLLIGAPLAFLFSVIYARVLLELIIVVFRIAEHTAEIAGQARRIPAAGGSQVGG